MKTLKNLFLTLLSIGYFFSGNAYSSTLIDDGSITFVGSIVESTCKSNENGLVCGDSQVLSYKHIVSTTSTHTANPPSMKAQVINKVKINDKTLIATIQYH